MEKTKIQKISQLITRLPGVRSIGIIGDPGCDGLGTYNMKVYAGVLEKSAKDDITMVVGDLVPEGTNTYYNTICSLTETVAENDVYVLRGNHDTGTYKDFFGLQNYALLLEDYAVIVLDNALRTFEEEGLQLLSRVLEMEEVKQAVVFFHIPVPNHFILNCVSEEEFERLKQAYHDHKEKVKYIVCGHVHSCFVDKVDDIPLLCTGGGGAMIEDVSEEIKASDIEHHMIHLFSEEGEIGYRFDLLSEKCYRKEAKDPILKEKILETVQGELMAHLKYLMYADRAKRRGLDQISTLFRALAASEYYHARNFYSVIERPPSFQESAKSFIETEQFEYQRLYNMLEKYADETDKPLAAQAYRAASMAEKVHAKLLKEVENLEEFSREAIYVCPICGFLMTDKDFHDRCPVCGSPKREYERFAVEE